MNISGIRPTTEFYSYNSIKTNVLRENYRPDVTDDLEQNEPDIELLGIEPMKADLKKGSKIFFSLIKRMRLRVNKCAAFYTQENM